MPSHDTPSATIGSPFSGLSPLFSAVTPASVSYSHPITESAQHAAQLPTSTPMSGGYDHVFSALGTSPFQLGSPLGSPIGVNAQGSSLYSSPELPHVLSGSFGFHDSPLFANFLPDTTEANDVLSNDALSDSSRSSSGLNTAFLDNTSNETGSPLSDHLSSLSSSFGQLSDDASHSSARLGSRSPSSDQLSDDASSSSTFTTQSGSSRDLKLPQSVAATVSRSALPDMNQPQDNQWSYLNQPSRSGRMPVKRTVFSPSDSTTSYRRVFGRLTLEQSNSQSKSKSNKSALKSCAKRSRSVAKLPKSKSVDKNRVASSYAKLTKRQSVNENRAPSNHVSSSMFQPAKAVLPKSTQVSDQAQAPGLTQVPTL